MTRTGNQQDDDQYRHDSDANLQKHVIETPLEAERILLDPTSGEMYSLNRTAQFVWERLDKDSPEQIAVQLVDAFDVTPARAEADMRALIVDLANAGVIETLDEVDPWLGLTEHLPETKTPTQGRTNADLNK